jgi:hypothetical protein
VAGKLAALPATNHVADPWPSIVGTACHAWAAEAFTADNLRKGLLRWVAEQKVTPHPEHPGTADLYDAVEQCVDDHKFLGPTSMAKIRKGWPRHYLVQLLLYGLGYHLLGLPVRRVVLIAYPRTDASLDGLYVRDTDFTDADGQSAARGPRAAPPSSPTPTAARPRPRRSSPAGSASRTSRPPRTTTTCYFCPFYRPQAARDSGPARVPTSCPGTTQQRIHASLRPAGPASAGPTSRATSGRSAPPGSARSPVTSPAPTCSTRPARRASRSSSGTAGPSSR